MEIQAQYESEIEENSQEEQLLQAATKNVGLRVILAGIGICSLKACREFLKTMIGYSGKEARLLIEHIPTVVAQYLTPKQADTLCRSMQDEGMQVLIADEDSYVDVQSDSGSGGIQSSTEGAGASLDFIKEANRVNRIQSWEYPLPAVSLPKAYSRNQIRTEVKPRTNPPPIPQLMKKRQPQKEIPVKKEIQAKTLEKLLEAEEKQLKAIEIEKEIEQPVRTAPVLKQNPPQVKKERDPRTLGR